VRSSANELHTNSISSVPILKRGRPISLTLSMRLTTALVNDLWLVDFGDPFPGAPAWHRSALVLGPPETFGPSFPFTLVAPLTTIERGISLHIEVEATSADVARPLARATGFGHCAHSCQR